MTYMRCTQKVLKEMGIKSKSLEEITGSDSVLGDWYVNLLRFHRRKCLLFTNEETLYSFLVYGVLKKDILNLNSVFVSNLIFNLQYEGIPAELAQKVAHDYSDARIAKTRSKSVLGTMVDIAKMLDFILEDEPIEQNSTLMHINYRINRTPFSVLKYNYPIDHLKATLESPSLEDGRS